MFTTDVWVEVRAPTGMRSTQRPAALDALSLQRPEGPRDCWNPRRAGLRRHWRNTDTKNPETPSMVGRHESRSAARAEGERRPSPGGSVVPQGLGHTQSLCRGRWSLPHTDSPASQDRRKYTSSHRAYQDGFVGVTSGGPYGCTLRGAQPGVTRAVWRPEPSTEPHPGPEQTA